MAHECPRCGMECYCDGEDHHQDAPTDCDHDCDEDAPFAIPLDRPQSFRLGVDPMPDWWMDAMSAGYVTTHNVDGRWSGGPDYARIGETVVRFGDRITRDMLR